ncbi:uncharacterized protein PFL1_06474 [Pseudozyma flocculosa PF-1]|uniref:Related to BSD2 - metal homeostasis protein n=2 Tax=Pseudozyma flocculosa TaxID=84751 RepID=A0A5C3EX57_9BASI|nr:uncharacterized protein PFL1_06474 [Pseudozyma flocculosa PF-1]EPQ26021.1 hypothetical protein PFL1_06474 [Pseudozyma flocculosa PF-1]SPO35671.1 related to BSD2 - metal homeostasis protein [Pseudozyma flocculosa]
MAPPSATRRTNELDAAFDAESSQANDPAGLPGYNELPASSRASLSRPAQSTVIDIPSNDVFFDAGDALPDDPSRATSATGGINDPLGVTQPNPALSRPYDPPPPAARTTPGGSTYDFERPSSYFPAPTRRPPTASSHQGHGPRVPSGMSAAGETQHGRVASQDDGHDDDDDDDHDHDGSNELHLGFADEDRGRSTNGQYGLLGGNQDLSRLDRARLALGRFGRVVGMGFPGARYEAVSRNGSGPGGAGGQSRRPRVMGGGIGQDGVFANLNAKPERPRRNGASGSEDRGEDDDLAEDTLPPTYEVAAADATPPYWETTILGTASGLHPLANGLGWVPGGAHVGAIEDLIIEGLPVGNVFGFAWNMMVSMTFQFVGFLLTYLLHTSHAARCGSRAGLGITLIQYGFYLRERATEIAEGKVGGDGLQGAWFGEDMGDQVARRSVHLVSRAVGILRRSIELPGAAAPGTGGTTLADAFAAQSDAVQSQQDLQQSMSDSTEWFSYLLMVIGGFILLRSVVGYWRIYRWGQSLVDAARREQAADDGTGAGAGEGETTEAAPVGFVHRFRSAFTRAGGGGTSAGSGRAHSAEDWIIFPGMGHRLGSSSGGGGRGSTSLRDLEDGEGLDDEGAELNPAERRLLQNMRSAGLLS